MQTQIGFRGAVFDVDGVLVDSPHEQARREALQRLMENRWGDIRDETSYSPDKFTPEVYQKVMSGKPRYVGAQAALEYFEVPDAEEYGDHKQAQITELIEAGEFEAFPNTLRVRLDDFAEEEGPDYEFIRPGYTLLDLLDADVSGRDFEQGKPHPMRMKGNQLTSKILNKGSGCRASLYRSDAGEVEG